MVRPLLNCLTALVLLPLAPVLAATVTSADFLSLTYTDSGGTLPYRLFVPKNYSAGTQYPLVLFLHGVGENGTNNTSQLNNRANGAFTFVEQDAHPAFMIAPQNWNGAGGWDSDVLRRQILAVIQKAQSDYSIDKDRIYVVGLSNGGAGTWNQINTHPWLYAAAVPVCGWGSATDKIKDIPIWCFHAADDGTVGVASSDNAINGLRTLGGNPIYTRYASGGHNSWGPAFSTPELVAWLFAQRRGVRDWTNIPSLRITSPTSNKGLTTAAATINLAGTATDMLPANTSSTGITSIDWTNVRSGGTDSGSATNGTSFSAANIPLTNGSNRIRFIATGTSFKSANGGNTTFTDVLYVYRSASTDTIAPTINITAPATSPFTTTTPILNFSGSASDNVGVVDWLWSSDRGYNGTCQNSWPVYLLPGSNVITLTANDGAGNTTTRTITVVLDVPSGNQPPVVNAGRDQTLVLPAATANLDGTVSDDGLAPGNSSTTVTWSKVSGPAVTFANAGAVDTTATFSGGAGVYVLRLTASDGVLSASDDLTVVVGQQRLLFDFGADTAGTSGNWNNVTTTTTGTKVSAARDSTGATTSVNLAFTTAFTGINSNGTTQATFYPASAQQDSFYVQSTAKGGLELTGLTSGATYHFSIFASRLGVDDRTTDYTLGGTTVTLDPTDNISSIVHIPNVAGGTVSLTVGADNGTGYGYIGVLDVVRLTSGSGGGDTANPAVTITSPTTSTTHAVSAATLTIGGTASDNVAVTQVTWASSRGGSGTATGTSAWSVTGIALLSGQNVLTVTARDAAGNSASDTLTVTYSPPASNNAPAISSGPVATPNPAGVNTNVAFAVAASDADNDALTYAWDFGDGSTESSAAPGHVFTSAGVFTVVVVVSDGRGGSATASVPVVVSAVSTPPDGNGGGTGGGGGSAPQDMDQDGVSDADEIAAGTDPLDPNSGPLRVLGVTLLQGSAKFGVDSKDACRVNGMVSELPALFNPTGVAAVLNIGGAVVPFTLNAKGQGKSDLGTFALKLKLLRDKATKTRYFNGGSAPFKAKIARGTWSDDWADEGVDVSSASKSVPMNLDVRLTLNGQLYGVTVQTLGAIKAGKGATFKIR